MGIPAAIPILGLIALAGFFIAGRIRSKRLLALWSARCERAESEKDRLEAALAVRDLDEQQRFARLEHDLRSALSVVVGFASILNEQAEKNTSLQPSLVLKSATAIHQAAKRTLLIIDSASTGQIAGELPTGHPHVEARP